MYYSQKDDKPHYFQPQSWWIMLPTKSQKAKPTNADEAHLKSCQPQCLNADETQIHYVQPQRQNDDIESENIRFFSKEICRFV